MSLIWATRGRTWGFRFLRDGGLADPLPAYDAAFAGVDAGPSAFHRVETTVAVRFPDPSGRKDASGRLIPHELVLFPPLSDQIDSVGDALERIWPLVAEEYEMVWDSEPT
jgi:hypothetical protein